MPLPFPVKAIAVFKDQNYAVGWTESMYILGQNTLKQASDAWLELLTRRVQMLGSGILLFYTSVSQDDPTLLGDVAASGGIPQSVDLKGNPYYNADYINSATDFAWTAVMCRADSNNLYHRTVWLSGAPDTLTSDPEGKLLDPDWLKKFSKWKDLLTNGGEGGIYGMKVWSKDQGISPIVAVTNADGLTGKVTVVALPAGLTAWAVGDLVFVHGIKCKLPRIRPHGQYQIAAIDAVAKTITLQGWLPGLDIGYLKGGYVRKRVPAQVPFTDCVNRSLRKKSRGRPLFLLRGKSRARPAS